MGSDIDFGANRAMQRQHRKAPSEVLPASQYLQERLQERRSRNTKPKRTRQSDFGPRTNTGGDDDVFLAEAEESKNASARLYDSSPLAPFARYGAGADNGGSNEASGGSGRRRRTLGAKELDEQMDRLTKQNFDLKLELDHRRENQAKLYAQIESMKATVERAELLQEEHAELLRINSLLVEELEKRDKAMQEAVDIICDLEAKVEDLEDGSDSVTETRPSTAQADSGYAGTETQEPPPASSPPEVQQAPRTARQVDPAAVQASQRLGAVVTAATPPRPKREPSFLTHKKPSTQALRSVFLETGKQIHPVQSFNSILSKRNSMLDDEPNDVLSSPRLSVLSESSFPSIYSPRKGGSPERHAWEPKDDELPQNDRRLESAHLREDSITRVSKWIQDRQNTDDTPSKSNRISSPLSAATLMTTPSFQKGPPEENFQSLNDTLLKVGPSDDTRDQAMHSSVRPFPLRSRRGEAGPRTPAYVSPNLGNALLPPTPDSASTRMLRASHSSIVDERSLLDTTPAQAKSIGTLKPSARTAPRQMRSSVELSNAYNHQQQQQHDMDGSASARAAYAQAALDDSESGEDDFDARSATVRDFSVEYEGYPDGDSIINGTPSRFLKHAKIPVPPKDMFFNPDDISPEETRAPMPHRRRSSVEVRSSHLKPDLHRSETSPTVLSNLARKMGIPGAKSPSSSDSFTSPMSYDSANSSVHTAIASPKEQSYGRPPSPAAFRAQTSLGFFQSSDISPSKSRSMASPTGSNAPPLSFAQKTQNMLRRLSNSTTSDRDQRDRTQQSQGRREREPSPLPTLTSTPSSAYNTGPARRPSLTASMRSPTFPAPARSETAPRKASRDSSGRRPSLQARTVTEPAAVETKDGVRRNPFRRGGSVRRVGEQEAKGKVKEGKKPWR